MSERRTIPAGVIAVVAEELGSAFGHTKIDSTFRIAGAEGEPALGSNRVDKIMGWLLWTNKVPTAVPLDVLGEAISGYMEGDDPGVDGALAKGRERIASVLAKNGLTYSGGKILVGGMVAAPSRSLEAILRARDLPSVEKEFTRALSNVEADPAAAVTAACAVIESFCRIHIEDHGLTMPAVQDLGGLWRVVRKDLKLDSVGDVADDDIKKVLGGLASIADGVAALRTHAGSAHGKGRAPFKILPRHARLAVHAAHTLVVYLVERGETVKK